MSGAWAKPGVKCVCVDADPDRFVKLQPSWRDDGFPIREGIIYTICEVLVHPGADLVAVRLVELPDRSIGDYGYALSRFRPLASRTQEQDLAIFRPILTSISVGEDA